MKVTLIDYTQNAVDKLLYTKATRLTQGEDTMKWIVNMTKEEQIEQLKYMANTVPSSWEFVNYTFQIEGVSRAFTHQLVRTRTGSYAQQAQRVCNMERFEYVTGPSIMENPALRAVYDECMEKIQVYYNHLIRSGAKTEDARGVLPTNICTNIIAQFNLRSLSDLIKKRTSKRAQGEYREVAMRMADAVVKVHPWAKLFLVSDRLAMIKKIEEVIDQHTTLTDEDKLPVFKLLDLLKG